MVLVLPCVMIVSLGGVLLKAKAASVSVPAVFDTSYLLTKSIFGNLLGVEMKLSRRNQNNFIDRSCTNFGTIRPRYSVDSGWVCGYPSTEHCPVGC